MSKYLNYIDTLKEEYINAQNLAKSDNHPFALFHYYEDVVYVVGASIVFLQSLRAVKLVNTAILFVDPENGSKVYFTDNDIAFIVASISNPGLKEHIIDNLKNAVAKKGLKTISFMIKNKTFTIKGIPFSADFNGILCENPANINMNGNDVIALINLVLEKERADKNPKKLSQTAKKYMGLA